MKDAEQCAQCASPRPETTRRAAAVERDTAGVRESLGPRAFLVRRQQARAGRCPEFVRGRCRHRHVGARRPRPSLPTPSRRHQGTQRGHLGGGDGGAGPTRGLPVELERCVRAVGGQARQGIGQRHPVHLAARVHDHPGLGSGRHRRPARRGRHRHLVVGEWAPGWRAGFMEASYAQWYVFYEAAVALRACRLSSSRHRPPLITMLCGTSIRWGTHSASTCCMKEPQACSRSVRGSGGGGGGVARGSAPRPTADRRRSTGCLERRLRRTRSGVDLRAIRRRRPAGTWRGGSSR